RGPAERRRIESLAALCGISLLTQNEVAGMQLRHRLTDERDLAGAEINHHVAVIIMSVGQDPVARLTTGKATQIQLILAGIEAHHGLTVEEYVVAGATG